MRTIGLTLLVLGLAACGRQDAGPATAERPDRAAVWEAIQPLAARYRMDPGFIYALVAAESNFDPQARNGEARGLLQLKPGAWRQVSSLPYEPAVWDWRLNLEAGIDYLAYTRSYLHRKGVYSYPRLLASFHYGVDTMERLNFDVGRVRVPANDIYRKLWAGNLQPVAPP